MIALEICVIVDDMRVLCETRERGQSDSYKEDGT